MVSAHPKNIVLLHSEQRGKRICIESIPLQYIERIQPHTSVERLQRAHCGRYGGKASMGRHCDKLEMIRQALRLPWDPSARLQCADKIKMHPN